MPRKGNAWDLFRRHPYKALNWVFQIPVFVRYSSSYLSFHGAYALMQKHCDRNKYYCRFTHENYAIHKKIIAVILTLLPPYCMKRFKWFLIHIILFQSMINNMAARGWFYMSIYIPNRSFLGHVCWCIPRISTLSQEVSKRPSIRVETYTSLSCKSLNY